ncbi:MAG TPA: glutathionylspermidine synthase family protein [Syntrophomonadaceae bacterium]|nr:glutathionylspermidine synthase family protein [Syntrophomonadaceae bacterium]
MRQEELTQHLNFEYYLVSSQRELEIFSPQPGYLNPAVFDRMVQTAATLYNLVDRLTRKYFEHPGTRSSLQVPDFVYRSKILDLSLALPPFFWVRFDAFERAKGGIFFSEFNYDKPCAQREILVSNANEPEGNPNQEFANKFRQGVVKLWEAYGNGRDRPNVGVLVDPNHYEESHLAFLYADLLKPLGYQCTLVGGSNLQVENEHLSAFGKPLDLILRQFPTEFSSEVHDYPKLLKLLEKRQVLMLNDPRAIVPQAKSLFAYLWQLYEEKSSWLSEDEAAAIRETIPYTRVYKRSDQEELLSEREHWVIKSVFGRYSEEVYIGAMMSDQDWKEVIDYINESRHPHVIQEFVPIKRQIVPRYDGRDYRDEIAFGNYGIYFTCGEFAGCCVRWSNDYLSLDDTVWFTPVGIRIGGSSLLKAQPLFLDEKQRRSIWDETAHIAAFQDDYSTSYTGAFESFTLEPVRLSRSLYEELVRATEELARVFLKTRLFILNNYELFSSLLGIPAELTSLLLEDHSEWLTVFGRFDWALDRQEHLRLLELNTDTPAGLESIGLNRMVHRFCPDCEDPNRGLSDLLTRKFKGFLSSDSTSPVKRLGLVACAGAEEDWVAIQQMGKILRPLFDEVVWGDITGITVREGSLLLNGQPVDVLYRYYPLEWLVNTKQQLRLLSELSGKRLVNPPSALVAQSKAFLAIVWRLTQEEFYLPEEKELINRYVVPTFLEWQGKPCIIKPYLEREGQGILYSNDLNSLEIKNLSSQNMVYQDLVDIKPIDISLYTSYNERFQVAYPILGTFLVGDQFGGLYTRLGARITDRYAVVVPTFIEE